MKTSSVLLATVTAAFVFTAQSAWAADLHELPDIADLKVLTELLRDQSAPEPASRSHGRGASRVQGLQLATGLQASGPLNGRGPAPVAARLGEEDWKKLFARKTAQK